MVATATTMEGSEKTKGGKHKKAAPAAKETGNSSDEPGKATAEEVRLPKWMTEPVEIDFIVKEETNASNKAVEIMLQQVKGDEQCFMVIDTPILEFRSGFLGKGGYIGKKYGTDILEPENSEESVSLWLDPPKTPNEDFKDDPWMAQHLADLSKFKKNMLLLEKKALDTMARDPYCKPKKKMAVRARMKKNNPDVSEEELIEAYREDLETDFVHLVRRDEKTGRDYMSLARPHTYKAGKIDQIISVVENYPPRKKMEDTWRNKVRSSTNPEQRYQVLSGYLRKEKDIDLGALQLDDFKNDPEKLHLYNACKSGLVYEPCSILHAVDGKWEEIPGIKKKQRTSTAARRGDFSKFRFMCRAYINKQQKSDKENPKNDNSGMYGLKGMFTKVVAMVAQSKSVGGNDFEMVEGARGYELRQDDDEVDEDFDQPLVMVPNTIMKKVTGKRPREDEEEEQTEQPNQNEDVSIDDEDSDGLSDHEREERRRSRKKQKKSHKSDDEENEPAPAIPDFDIDLPQNDDEEESEIVRSSHKSSSKKKSRRN